MLFYVRSIAVKTAVVCFFGLSFISSIYGLSPLTCCKRAVTAAAITYIVATFTVKAINAILTNAIVNNQMNHPKEEASDTEN